MGTFVTVRVGACDLQQLGACFFRILHSELLGLLFDCFGQSSHIGIFQIGICNRVPIHLLYVVIANVASHFLVWGQSHTLWQDCRRQMTEVLSIPAFQVLFSLPAVRHHLRPYCLTDYPHELPGVMHRRCQLPLQYRCCQFPLQFQSKAPCGPLLTVHSADETPAR